MSSKFVLLPSETPLPVALGFLGSKGVDLLGVLSSGHVAGAVTRAKIQEMLGTSDPMTLLCRKTLASIVPPYLTTVAPDDPVDRASRYMIDRNLSALPVLSEEKIVGIITPTDICRAFCEVTGTSGEEAPIVMMLTATHETDLLEEIGRRSCGFLIHSLLAYATASRETAVMLRLRKSTAPLSATSAELEACV
jgi:signal-transduction protein with cAMP-binding, CBS, and nucleotidyltransferase domain